MSVSGLEELSGLSSGKGDFGGLGRLPPGLRGEYSGAEPGSGMSSGLPEISGLPSGIPTVSLVDSTLVEVFTVTTAAELEGRGTLGVSGSGHVSGLPWAEEQDVSGEGSGSSSGLVMMLGVPLEASGPPDLSGEASGIPSGSTESSGISGLSEGVSGIPDISGDPGTPSGAASGSGDSLGITFVDTSLVEVAPTTFKEEEGLGSTELSGLPSGETELASASGTMDGSGQAPGITVPWAPTPQPTELLGLPSSETEASGDISGAEMASGDLSGLPKISLVNRTLVVSGTLAPTAQEAEGSSGTWELSGVSSGSWDVSGFQPSRAPPSSPPFSGDFPSPTVDISGDSSAATSTSGDSEGLPEVTLITSEFLEGVTSPTLPQELGQRIPPTHIPPVLGSSGEGSGSGDMDKKTLESETESSAVLEFSKETLTYPSPQTGTSASGEHSGSLDLGEAPSSFPEAFPGASGEGLAASEVSGETVLPTEASSKGPEASGWSLEPPTASGDRTEGSSSGLGIVISTRVSESEWVPPSQPPAEALEEIEASGTEHSGEETQAAAAPSLASPEDTDDDDEAETTSAGMFCGRRCLEGSSLAEG